MKKRERNGTSTSSGRKKEDIHNFRRLLHAHPELSERENGTARRIAERLSACGAARIATGLGSSGTGVCAVYEGGEPGPTVLLRCELDALPIAERNEFAHRSTVPGVSHKCGHDGHMATLVALAEDLAARPPGRGRVLLLFQPAEETGTGAAAVLADPRFAELGEPNAVYAFHNIPRHPLGTVLLRAGTFAQASVGFIAEFRGRTSHSSYPEHGLNPTAAATELVGAVNGFADSARAWAGDPVLGTVTYVRIGGAETGSNFGITPGEASVSGVLRAQKTADLERLRAELDSLAVRLAAGAGLACSVSWHEAFAATESDADHVEVVRAAARERGLAVQELDEPFRWSEDFGLFTQRFPGAFFGLGSGAEQPQLHDDGYDYPDDLIDIGARLYRSIVDRHLTA